MNIEVILEFIDLAETLNFTKTAQRCRIAQPALSKHIAAMEKELGVELFKRDKRHVELTPIAQDLLAEFQGIAKAWGSIELRARQHRRGINETIMVGYLKGCAESTIPIAHALFKKEHPQTDVDYRTYSYYDLLSALDDDLIDLAIGARPIDSNLPFSFELQGIALFSDQIYVVRRSDEGAEPKPSLRLADLEGTTVLSLPDTTRFSDRTRFAEIFAEAGVNVKFDDRFGDLDTLPLKLTTEDCVAMLPLHLKAFFDERHPGKFCFSSVEDMNVVNEYGLAWKRHNKKYGLEEYAHIFAENFVVPA